MLVPPEIVAQILSHLDTVVDLLNCRLVGHSWNKECLLLIKKKKPKVHLTLDKENIQRFLDFVTADSAKLTQLETTSCFEWKFEVDVWEGLTEPQNRDAFGVFAAQVTSVLNLFGPECVDKLRLDNRNLEDATDGSEEIIIPKLVQFFSNMSAGLSRVTFTGKFFNGIPASARTRFPKLKSIKFTAQEKSYQNNKAVDFFGWETMENLEEFKVRTEMDDWYGRLSFQRLKSLEITYFHDENVSILRYFIRQSPPLLRKFSFEVPPPPQIYLFVPRPHEQEYLIDILTYLRSTLKSLKLIVNKPDRPAMMPLPRLPHLQKFRIERRAGFDSSISLNPATYHFTQGRLPSLQKVDLPVGYRFTQGLGAQMPTVVRLTLRLLKRQTQSTRSSMKECVENMQDYFPNLRSMTVVKETLDGLEGNQDMKNLLLGIMESSRGSSLQELVIRNGDEDFKHSNFLGEILTELSKVQEPRVTTECKMTNGEMGHVAGVSRINALDNQQQCPTGFTGIQKVKTIRFEQISSRADEYRRQARRCCVIEDGEEYERPQPRTPSQKEQQSLKNRSEIRLLVQHFQRLVQIEMSPPFFGQTNKLSCFAEILELATAFPTLTIQVI